MPNHVIEGPRWFRTRIRSQGPFVALIVPAVLGVIAVITLRLGDSTASGLIGLVLGVFAAPGLLAVGAPFSSASLYPIGVAISVGLWLVVGLLASRRATRNPMASWADFWRNYWWLAGGIWVGATAALLIARYALGEALV
jgi:hypothetical protein